MLMPPARRQTVSCVLALALTWPLLAHAAPGDIDTRFNAGTFTSQFFLDSLSAMAVQPDGRIMIGGPFNTVAGVARHGLARLMVDGSVDPTFVPPLFPQGDLVSPKRIVVQPDGKVIVAGNNFRVGGTVYQVIRLNDDGSLDPSFTLVPINAFRGVEGLALQPDGRILIGGDFTSVAGVPRKVVARLTASGALDAGFAIGVPLVAHDGRAEAFAVQPDGKIIAGGALFVTVGGVTFANVVRLEANGTPDPTFRVEGDSLDIVHAVVLQADGRVFIGGSGSANVGSRRSLTRVTTTGSSDPTFTSAVSIGGEVYDLALDPTGQMIAVGNFCTTPFGQGCAIAGFNHDGSRAAFYPVTPACGSNGPDNTPLAVVREADGSVLVAGRFQTLSCLPRQRIARLQGVAGAPPTVVQPPLGLHVSALAGNDLTLRWTASPVGPPATSFVVEGGVLPGQVLGSLPVAGALPLVTFTAPTGAFFLRVHAVAGGVRSGASNEIQVFVNTLTPPSPPAGLAGVVNGAALGLAWRTTFGGGTPASFVLDVTGAAAATVSLPLTETFAYPALPGGTYTFRVRAANAAGTSGDSNSVTLTFPGACSGAPAVPVNFLAYAAGSVVQLLWEPPASGAAATSYVVTVGGSFSGAIPFAVRSFSSAAPAGTYTFTVAAVNSCGIGPSTAVQTVVVP